MTTLSGWQNFYVIIGTAAGTLIGLQFVVMTLVANKPISHHDANAGDAFTTPTVVHFEVALLLSAMGCAPWDGLDTIAVVWGGLGFVGVVYIILVARRLRSQTAYQPVFEDWLFHVLLPFVAYLMFCTSACMAYSYARPALFVVGAAALLLLFIGIHNAWDIIRYHVFHRKREQGDDDRQK